MGRRSRARKGGVWRLADTPAATDDSDRLLPSNALNPNDWSPSMPGTRITVETNVRAPIAEVWRAYTTPADITQWNAASDDWHTTRAAVDLRVGGEFSSRMEAKDGSVGFDFAGIYTKVEPNKLLEYTFGDRVCVVTFAPMANGTTVRVSFDAEEENSVDMQRGGWQAILENFRKFVEGAR